LGQIWHNTLGSGANESADSFALGLATIAVFEKRNVSTSVDSRVIFFMGEIPILF